MRNIRKSIFLALAIGLLGINPGIAQETVFSGLKGDLKRADKYYENQSFKNALNLYLQAEKRKKGGPGLFLKIARSYFHLNQSLQSTLWFEKYVETGKSLTPEDVYLFAESLSSEGRYDDAVTWYKEFQRSYPDNQGIIKKIWRLSNIEYLYVDSSYYEITPVSFNTEYAEYGVSYIENYLVFVSDRKDKGGVSKIDPITNQSFHSLYKVSFTTDSINDIYEYGKPKGFLKEQNKKLHQGPLTLAGGKLVFTRTANYGSNTLQLFTVEKQGNSWRGEQPFEYNSDLYSVSHPSLTSNGETLYFVSDMPGGMGGKDIYKSNRKGNGWSEPENLGKTINTSLDETAPFIHNNKALYFASNGHAGLGGFDVFKAILADPFSIEIQNLGFPINTPADDFGLILNQQGTHGYFASNRGTGGFNDDIYQVSVDLQTYPLIISGVVKYNDPDWSESNRLEFLPHAQLKLIDNISGLEVYETITDHDGSFSLSIPYSSKYKLNVSQDLVGNPMVSLEIPRNRKLYTDHEIVVVKEKFKKSKSTNLNASNNKKLETGGNQKNTK